MRAVEAALLIIVTVICLFGVMAFAQAHLEVVDPGWMDPQELGHRLLAAIA